jgi:Fe-coproporphyrin III synthase
MKGPSDAILAVTFRCNSRCVMCDVWRKPSSAELSPQMYERLPRSLAYINVSGGEPFLRDDLPDVIRILDRRCHHPKMDISSNGLAPVRVEQHMKEILKTGARVGVRISLHGLGVRHDQVENIQGAFEKATTSLDVLRELGVKDVGVAFTGSDSNFDQLSEVIAFAKRQRIQFTFCGVAHNSPVLFGSPNRSVQNLTGLKRQLDLMTIEHIKSFSPRDWVRGYIDSGNYHWAATRSRKIPCFAGTDFFFATPDGNIYPDMVLDRKFGNIKDQTFAEIWNSAVAVQFRESIRDVSRCPNPCWMLCTVFPYMRRHPAHFAKWIVANKLRAHLGMATIPVQG